MGGGGHIVAQVLGVEYGIDLIACTFIDGCKYCADTCYRAVIILYGLDSRLGGVSRGYGCGEDEDVLAGYHGDNVIAEDKLASRCMLGGDHVDGLVSIQIQIVTVSKLLGKAGADHLGAVEAEDGIDDGAGAIIGDQLLCDRLRLGKTGFLCCYVYIIIYMAMAGCKMAFRDAKVEVFVLCSDFGRVNGWHL